MTRRACFEPQVRSRIPGVEWPPLTSGPPAALAALLDQLERSQWLDRETIRAGQFRQLRVLAEHAMAHSPHFARRLRAAGLTTDELATPGGLARLPALRRREIQDATDLFCDHVPPDHSPVRDTFTSGSTGQPVHARRTQVCELVWLAHMVRDDIWHRRDVKARRCSIRVTTDQPRHFTTWGGLAGALFETGEVLVIPSKLPVAEQMAMIDAFGPDNLLTYPATIAALLEDCRIRGRGFEGLNHMRTVGGALSPALREEVAAFFGVSVTDSYSAQEVGYLTLQCPDAPLYHVMAETVIIELVREDGAACDEGEIGRVLVTDLHNFATPLIRYDVGDYAEAGPPCPCGRGLPTIRRVVGRERNLVRLPNGRRHWPWFSHENLRDIAPVRQFQLIQHSLERIELRLACDRPLTANEEAAVRAAISRALDHEFAMELSCFPDDLPADPGGKFEEFICRIG